MTRHVSPRLAAYAGLAHFSPAWPPPGVRVDDYVGNMLALTAKGRYYWVIMMREFFTSVNNFRDYCRSIINLPLAH